jgi:hypothetical protein
MRKFLRELWSRSTGALTPTGNAFSRRSFLAMTGAAVGTALVGCGAVTRGYSRRQAVATRDTTIVRAEIYPGIGIARIGNATGDDDAFVGPEVFPAPPTAIDDVRDATGAIRRQAARFRVYGYNANDELVGEVTAADAGVELAWTVEIANKKPAWYRFLNALDIDEATDTQSIRRNEGVKGQDRAGLAITPGPRTVRGKAVGRADAPRFDTGKFQDEPVYLGELRTDDRGRLLVLGGLGKSVSPTDQPIYDAPDPARMYKGDPDSFNNASGWYDDIADGPVDATLTIDGRPIPVKSAWVAVAPPNFAPDIVGWRTMYDLLVDTYMAAGMMTEPMDVSFTEDILPIFERLSNLQWVNAGFLELFGVGTQYDVADPSFVKKLLGKPVSSIAPTDVSAFKMKTTDGFRPLDPGDTKRLSWPPIYGDAYGSFQNTSAVALAPSPRRAKHLTAWAAGTFTDDYQPDAEPPRQIEDVDLSLQPDMLNQGALGYCLADAFHPGCELTWPMRHKTIYSEPFRIKRRPPMVEERDYGEVLTKARALADDGPLHEQGPGDLTRWMALPWQGDTAFCRSGYDDNPAYGPYLPTFWPARVPNQVLTEAQYAVVTDARRSKDDRMAAFGAKKRAGWLRALRGTAPAVMKAMIDRFGNMGIVVARRKELGVPGLPDVMYVESLPEAAAAPHGAPVAAEAPPPPASPESTTPQEIVDAGFDSVEQFEEFRRIIGLT